MPDSTSSSTVSIIIRNANGVYQLLYVQESTESVQDKLGRVNRANIYARKLTYGKSL